VLSDFHLLVFISNVLDMTTDMPVLCDAIANGENERLEGYHMMLNAFAEIEGDAYAQNY